MPRGNSASETAPTQRQAMGLSRMTSIPRIGVLIGSPPALIPRIIFRMTLLYHLPTVKSDNAFARGVLNGWWTGSLVSWETVGSRSA